MTRHVGFLFFHHTHHIYHSAPIAYELSRMDRDIHVHMFTASDIAIKLFKDLGEFYPGHRVSIHRTVPNFTFRHLNLKRRSFPKPRFMLRKAATEINQMDVVVGTSFGTSRLFEELNITHPKYVFAFHGAGDGAYGFKESLAKYDFLLLSGEKIRARLENLGALSEKNYAIIGYPKFDVAPLLYAKKTPLFSNNRPTVLYNPHWNRSLSSWYGWGRGILDYFAASEDFNLIFAPHLLLKEWKQKWLSLKDYNRLTNIHIDLGSAASVDMTYTLASDIYLGDVSSQIYEFIYNPRPCLFLNKNRVDWPNDPNYAHWHLGEVLDHLPDLDAALHRAKSIHDEYKLLQQVAMAETINTDKVSAGKRGAIAIAGLLLE